MKSIKNISVILLATLIFIESVGVQVIRDICLPCQSETVVIRIPVTHYEPKYDDSCHTDKSCSEESRCCEKKQHNSHDCKHQQKIQFLSKDPDFPEINTTFRLKFFPDFITVFNKQPGLRYLERKLLDNTFIENKLLLPKDDRQSFLCTYIV